MCGITGFVGFGKKNYPIETVVKIIQKFIFKLIIVFIVIKFY